VNFADDRARWLAAGSPPAASLVVDGVLHAVPHPTNAARVLGIPIEARHDPVRVAAGLVRVLDAWLECLRVTPWPLLLEPTPSRDRTPRELAVNVFKFVELLPGTWESGALEVGMERWLTEERTIEVTLTDRAKLIAYAEPIRHAVASFLDEMHDDFRDAESRFVLNAGGGLSYADILDGQRNHAAQHYRQVATFLDSVGAPVPTDALEGIPLPSRIY
jgi:hypothetical protein